MENYAIKGRGGNDVQHKDWKGKVLRIWIKIIRHGGLGHEVQESWPYLSNATPWPYELNHLSNFGSSMKGTANPLIWISIPRISNPLNPFSKRIPQIKSPHLDLPKGTQNSF